MNIAQLFFDQVEQRPRASAMLISSRRWHKKYHYRHVSFQQLGNRTKYLAGQLYAHGIAPGDKVLMFLPPGEDFPAVTFALFWLGACPVFIDPGMGKTGLLQCVRQVRPKYLIGSGAAMALSAFEIESFTSVNKFFSLTPAVLAKNLNGPHSQWQLPLCYQATAHELAAILFTSGATGPAKGVEYTHNIFIHQTNWLKNLFQLQPGDIDFPAFPLFSLFTLAMGMTTCPPDMNAAAPGRCDPKRLTTQILDNKATFLAGSPAIWKRVAQYCLQQGIQLPSVRQLVMFGAPVSVELHRQFRQILPNGDTFTPYGATESLPISCISGSEILKESDQLSANPGVSLASRNGQGSGTCVGTVVTSVEVMIIKSHLRQMFAEDLIPLENGEIGEILVAGPVVTTSYFQLPEATQNAKVIDQAGRLWHRMGDVGYKDEQNRLWFCGRQSHIAQGTHQLLYSDPVEGIFNNHPAVVASALVPMLGQRLAALVVIPGKYPRTPFKRRQLAQSLKIFSQQSAMTTQIRELYIARQLPVDNRHNIKIDRLELAKMIARGELQRID